MSKTAEIGRTLFFCFRTSSGRISRVATVRTG